MCYVFKRIEIIVESVLKLYFCGYNHVTSLVCHPWMYGASDQVSSL